MEPERKKSSFLNDICPDLTHKYHPDDIKKNKPFAFVAFLSFLIVPFFFGQLVKAMIGISMMVYGYSWKSFAKPLILLGVFGILFLISLFKAKKSRYVKFYLNQGLSFSIWGSILFVVCTSLFGHIPAVVGFVLLFGFIFYFVFGVGFGVYNLIRNKVRRNPIIGKKTFLKL